MTKTIKTIIFTALIAVTIISFAGMQSVYAHHDETHPMQGANIPEGVIADSGNLPVGTILDTTPEMEIIPENSREPKVMPQGPFGPEVEVIQDRTHNIYSPVEVIPDGSLMGPPVVKVPDNSHNPEVPTEPEN